VLLLETIFSAILLIVAFLRPTLGLKLLSFLEHKFRQLSQRRTLSVVIAGITALLPRLAVLPVLAVPVPAFQDDFSYLLAADTFAHHRVANLPHPMWHHFETFHVLLTPNYASMYPPAQGLLLLTGTALGHPFVGVLLSLAGMSGAICWMLQGWMPPQWALLGAILATIRLTIFTYWGNSYCGGALAAIGGALLLGALPRLMRLPSVKHATIAAIGMVLLANSRPYEGFLLSLAAFACLLSWIITKKPNLRRVVGIAIPALVLLAITVLAMGRYNLKVTGNFGRMPYQVNRAQYGTAPYFIWQKPNHAPIYRHQVMRNFYTNIELAAFVRMRSISGSLRENAFRLVLIWAFYFGPLLTIPFLFFPCVVSDRRIRALLVPGAVVLAGISVVSFFIPHYLATISGVFMGLAVQGLRHLRAWGRREGSPGVFLARAVPLACLISLPVHAMMLGPSSTTSQSGMGLQRARIVSMLNQLPGDHLVFVQYGNGHDALQEWVYNGAEIDGQKIVWARDMGAEENEELIRYYPARRVWIVTPDEEPAQLHEYSRANAP
jgi:hypothetical protein